MESKTMEFLKKAESYNGETGDWEFSFGSLRKAGNQTLLYTKSAGPFGYSMPRHLASDRPLAYRIRTRGADDYEYAEVQFNSLNNNVYSIHHKDKVPIGSKPLNPDELALFELLFMNQLHNFKDEFSRHKDFLRKYMKAMSRETAINTLHEYCASTKPSRAADKAVRLY